MGTSGGAYEIYTAPSGTYSPVGGTAQASQAFLEKLRLGQSAVWAHYSDSTANDLTEYSYLTAVNLGVAYPAMTVKFHRWTDGQTDYDASTTIQTGTGTGTLDVYNCAVAGVHTTYYLAPYFDAMVTKVLPDLVTVAQGHNESLEAVNVSGSDYTARMLALCGSIQAACPQAAGILIGQNPEAFLSVTDLTTTNGSPSVTSTQAAAWPTAFLNRLVIGAGIPTNTYIGAISVTGGVATISLSSSSSSNVPVNATASATVTATLGSADQAARSVACAKVAGRLGWGFVNFHRAFVDTGNGPIYPTYLVDGVHPNTAGIALEVTELAKAFVYATGAGPRPQPRSSFLEPGESLWTNANFATFDGSTVPTGWTNNNCTYSKDVVNYEGANGYGVRLQAATAAGASIFQDCTRFNIVKGGWVTVAVRMFVKAGQAATAGRINLQVIGGTGAVSLTSSTDSTGQGAFRWVVLSAYVPSDATSLRLRVYCDSGSAGTGDVVVDRVVTKRGLIPAGAIGTDGPTGATGATGAQGAAGSGSSGVKGIKTGNETRTGTAITADADIHCALLANTTYAFRMVIPVISAGASTSIKYSVTVPSGATGHWNGMGLQPTATTQSSSLQMSSQSSFPGTNASAAVLSGTQTAFRVDGLVTTGVTAGDLTFQWAENDASAIGVTVLANAVVHAIPIG